MNLFVITSGKRVRYVFISLFCAFLFSSCTFHEIDIQSVENFTIEQMNTEGIAIGLDVKINNPNRFAIKVKAIDLNIYVNNDFLTATKLKKAVKIKPKSTNTYHFVISDKNGSLNKKIIPKLMLNGLAGGKLPLTYKGFVKGKVFIFSKKIPVDGKKEFSL